MAYPTAAGFNPTTAYSGSFIPEVWSRKLLVKFYDATVLSEICSTDYEGEIKAFGDRVHIRQVPTMVINDYQAGASLTYDTPSAPVVDLTIDKGKYFAFKLDSVMKHQSDLDLLDNWATDASEQMKIAVDKTVLGSIYANADAANKGAAAGRISGGYNLGTTGAPVGINSANVLDVIVDAGSVLDEQNIPETGRFLVIPAWLAGMIKKSDLKDASISGDGVSVMRNGRLGVVDRFTLYSSNNLTNVTDGANLAYHVLAGHPIGTQFAAQMTDMETLRDPNTFGDLVRGLNVFGFKVTKAQALVDLYVYKAS